VPLIGLEDVLSIAERKRCAIPAFNVYNMETVMGVVKAAEETNSAVIVQMYSRLFNSKHARYLAPMIKEVVNGTPIKAAFHLDHGSSDAEVVSAIRLGATGVMRDASTLPLQENIEATRRVVDLCTAVNVGVEGELGHIGSAKDSIASESTSVSEAVQFVQETGVVALAIAVGTAHGRYKQAPRLDIQRIYDIKVAAGLPLVLHGGSGVPDDQIRQAIEAGIRKVNFGTDLCYSFLDSVSQVDRNIVAVDLFMKEPIESVKRFASEKIRLLGAVNSND
jgi:ketose-bisphosphate aldolase